MALGPGARLGPYEIVSLLGAGGMGEVYRARDPRLGCDVAIKVVLAAFAADGERVHRFEQEARAAATLNQPNILAVYDIGQHEGAPYVVSEVLEGDTLRERLSAGALPVRKALDYSIQIARGLAAAHEKGIVHRDLKPENVFVTSDGRVKILDFLPPAVELYSTNGSAVAISPDGRSLAFVGGQAAIRQAYVRRLDQSESSPLRGVGFVLSLAFSPDNESIAMMSSDGALRKVSLKDGVVVTVARATDLYSGIAWGPDDRIVFGSAGTPAKSCSIEMGTR